MKTLIIYDNTGNIFSQVSGAYNTPEGIPFLEEEIPSGKFAVRVDVSTSTHTLVLADVPPTDIENMRAELEHAILELTMLIYGGGL